jgi:hypothetical protein
MQPICSLGPWIWSFNLCGPSPQVTRMEPIYSENIHWCHHTKWGDNGTSSKVQGDEYTFVQLITEPSGDFVRFPRISQNSSGISTLSMGPTASSLECYVVSIVHCNLKKRSDVSATNSKKCPCYQDDNEQLGIARWTSINCKLINLITNIA